MTILSGNNLHQNLTTPLVGISVLIVDDDENIRELLCYYLDSLGAKTEVAENGIDAASKVFQQNYNVILMDVNLPGISGMKTLKVIRDGKKNTPVIALTGNSDDEFREHCLTNGFTDFISKPFVWDDLIDKILIHSIQYKSSEVIVH